jgi:hypothetical protein
MTVALLRYAGIVAVKSSGATLQSRNGSQYLGVRCCACVTRTDITTYRCLCNRATIIASRQIAFANEQPLLLISERCRCLERCASQNPESVSSALSSKYGVRYALLGRREDQSALGRWLEPLELRKRVYTVLSENCSLLNGRRGSIYWDEGENSLRALADYRRRNGQITFGIFLRGQTNEESPLQKKR